MTAILSVNEFVRDHWVRCADEARRLYRDAVRPIFRRLPDGRPEQLGSSVLLEVQGRKWLATAAHVLDGHKEASLHLGARGEIIPLNATFNATTMPAGGREGDSVDVAVAELTSAQVEKLGELPFVPMADQLVEPPLRPTDFFLAVGYRASQNKPPRPGVTRLPVTVWSYKGLSAAVPMPEKRAHRGAYNFALEYPKRAARATGEAVPTTPPHGVSGGAIFHLGDLASVDQLGSPEPHRPKLAGIVIECNKGARVLVGTKLIALRDAIDELVAKL
jgi:hypothetical protein